MTKPKQSGILIDDGELRERFGADAEMIIDALDRNPMTQKHEAMHYGKRYRPAVEAKLKEMGK